MLRCWPKRHKRGWVRTRTLWGLAKCVPPKKRFGVSIIVLFNFLNFSLKSKAFLLTVARRQRLLSFIVLSFKRKGVVRNCALRNTFFKKKNEGFLTFPGNDQRHYILDLLKTYPPDLNYLPIEGETLPDECAQMGFPKKHRHRLATLRPELVEAYVDSLYVLPGSLWA